MGTIRIRSEAQQILNSVSKMRDLKKGLASLAQLSGIVVEEEEKTTRYNQTTGEPSARKWFPYEWDGELWFDDSSNSPQLWHGPFTKLFKKEYEEGSFTIIKIKDGEWVVIYFVPEDSSGGGTIPSHLLIKKAKKI